MPSWAKWGCIAAGRCRPCLGGLARLGDPGDAAHPGVFRARDRHHAAERQRGGSCRRVRRRRQPDGLRPARCRDVSLSRDHLVRDRFHDDVADAFLEARPRPQTSTGSILEQTQQSAPAPAKPSQAPPVKPAAPVTPADTSAEPGSQELAASVTISSLPSELRSWRNWQTHQLEGLALARAWWFESTRPHQISREEVLSRAN